MSALRRVAAPPRARLLAGLPGLLSALPDPLHILIEDVRGLSGPIDVVARDGRGGAVAVRFAGTGEDLAALTDLLAQCDWLEPRLADWLKLNPALGVRPDLGVRGLLLAGEFDPRTVAAARALREDAVALARVSAFEGQAGFQLALEPVALRVAPAPDEAPAAHPTPVPAPIPVPMSIPSAPLREPSPLAEIGAVGEVTSLESRFRTGLRDDELGLPRRPRSAPRGS